MRLANTPVMVPDEVASTIIFADPPFRVAD